MSLPGFTAEVSLHQLPHQITALGTLFSVARNFVVPALRSGDVDGDGGGRGGGGASGCVANCMADCIAIGGSAQGCATQCGRQCFPTGPFTGPNDPQFTGPCEDQWWSCIQSAGASLPGQAACYGKWVYCKASSGM